MTAGSFGLNFTNHMNTALSRLFYKREKDHATISKVIIIIIIIIIIILKFIVRKFHKMFKCALQD